jgi:hypothetical protein
MWAAIAIVIVIIIIFLAVRMHKARCGQEREFMTGFWGASPESCNAQGYREAYLYMARPDNDTNISRAYIIALKGGRGVINRPFDFDVEHAWTKGGKICGKINVDGHVSDMAIDLDLLVGRMVWRDSFGRPLFTWEKNARLNSDLVSANEPR